ncbi:MAG: hypothetical protein DWQ07_13940 [Chloroflexi bacterium]|nr:MAG: hypothetical protein DWQ07_13940 [Chloroflexota bacterium]
MKRLYLTLALILTACSSGPTDAEQTATFDALVKEAEDAMLTEQSISATETDAAIPPTPTLTRTPQPTSTPVPTRTPQPTLEPLIFSGSGDMIIDLPFDTGPAIIHVVGNAAGRHFAVESYDENNDQVNLLVNTTDPYDGVRPFDLLDRENSTRLVVTAVGEWTIEIQDLLTAPLYFELPVTIVGSGDSVVILHPDLSPDVATITGNAESRHFAVVSYSSSGTDLLVNTTDEYSGIVLLDTDTFIIEIDAIGEWRIEITGK